MPAPPLPLPRSLLVLVDLVPVACANAEEASDPDPELFDHHPGLCRP